LLRKIGLLVIDDCVEAQLLSHERGFLRAPRDSHCPRTLNPGDLAN
jgi:hypothetical protein